jgi:NAD-dependent deacetylase
MSLKDYFTRNIKDTISKKIYIYSGAGISAEAGIPTFRGNDGLWENHNINEVCDFRTWEDNYDLVHEFYNKRRTELKNKLPTEAHKIVKLLQDKLGVHNIINVTTNIDNLFEKAGVKNTNYLHGNLCEMIDYQKNKIINIKEKEFTKYKNKEEKYKPHITFFNEPAPAHIIMKKNTYDMKDGDVVICIGMSFNVVHPIQIMPYNKNIRSVNINLNEETHKDYIFSETLTMSASDGLASLLDSLLD